MRQNLHQIGEPSQDGPQGVTRKCGRESERAAEANGDRRGDQRHDREVEATRAQARQHVAAEMVGTQRMVGAGRGQPMGNVDGVDVVRDE